MHKLPDSVKLHSYGVSKSNLQLILNYLSRYKQRKNISSLLGTCYDIIAGVPHKDQFFKTFTNGLFLFIKRPHVYSLPDDIIWYSCNRNLSVIFQDLVHDLNKVLIHGSRKKYIQLACSKYRCHED